MIDSQVVEVRPGVHPGIPVWSPSPSTGSGALVACLAGAPLDIGPAVWQHLLAGSRRRAIGSSASAGAFHACSGARQRGWRCFLKAMRGRGEAPGNRRRERGAVAWPSDGPVWPADALGIFPQDLPLP